MSPPEHEGPTADEPVYEFDYGPTAPEPGPLAKPTAEWLEHLKRNPGAIERATTVTITTKKELTTK